jgi:hypothetical protein
MEETHEIKNSDYASDTDPYSNFKFACDFAQTPLYKVYLVLLGVKVARLHELLKGKTPKNESINDTFLDFCTYATIMSSNLMDEHETEARKNYPDLFSVTIPPGPGKSTSRRVLPKSKVERKKVDTTASKKRTRVAS